MRARRALRQARAGAAPLARTPASVSPSVNGDDAPFLPGPFRGPLNAPCETALPVVVIASSGVLTLTSW